MPISFSCGHCGRGYTVADELAGRSVPCKVCDRAVRIPRVGEESEPLDEFDEEIQPKRRNRWLVNTALVVLVLGGLFGAATLCWYGYQRVVVARNVADHEREVDAVCESLREMSATLQSVEDRETATRARDRLTTLAADFKAGIKRLTELRESTPIPKTESDRLAERVRQAALESSLGALANDKLEDLDFKSQLLVFEGIAKFDDAMLEVAPPERRGEIEAHIRKREEIIVALRRRAESPLNRLFPTVAPAPGLFGDDESPLAGPGAAAEFRDRALRRIMGENRPTGQEVMLRFAENEPNAADLKGRLKEIVGARYRYSSRNHNGRVTHTISPVKNLDAFIGCLDFGIVTDMNQELRTLTLNGRPGWTWKPGTAVTIAQAEESLKNAKWVITGVPNGPGRDLRKDPVSPSAESPPRSPPARTYGGFGIPDDATEPLVPPTKTGKPAATGPEKPAPPKTPGTPAGDKPGKP